MANKINFEVGFTTNSKGLQELKSELAEIRALASNDKGFGGDLSKIQAMVKSANDLEYAMTAAFDVDLNTVNIQKFNQILKQSKTDLSQIQQNLAYAGTAGQSAFLKATAGLMQFNTAAKQTNQFLDSIATSFANTIKWSAMSSIVNTITGTIQKSYYYVKDLDSALNDIRIVTGKNADEMSRFAEEANNAAKALAVTTEDYTQGSLIYYQQGLDDETVKALTDITAKTSNVTGQSMSAVSEELTAVWNGYQVANEAAQEGMQVYEEYVDKMAAVGASTASDLEELSKAMSKVASAASSMGVGFDDLNAQIATIVSVTRQAPESVGTALKTIYARLGDLKVDGVDEFGVKLGEVSAQLKQMGIEVLDQNGNLRDMTPVMAEVAEKWNSWTEAQRQAAAVAMAGKRQYNNLIALFDNWDMYGDALKTSMEAAGTLEEQQEIALDSLSNKMDQLKATAEDLYDSLYDEEDIKGLVEGLTKVVQGIADFSDAIGGLKNLIPMLGSVAAGVFSNQIAKGLSTIVINAQNARKETQMMTDNYNQLKMMFSDSALFSSVEDENMNSGAMKQGVEQLEKYYSTMQQYQGIMSEEQKETYNSVLNNIAKVGELNIEIEKSAQSLDKEQKSWKLIDTSLLENEKDLKGFSDQVQRTSKLATELGKALALSEGESKISRKEAYDVIYKIGKESKLSTEEIKQLKKEFQDLANKTGDNNEAFKQFVEQLQKTGASAEEVQKLVQQMRNLRDGTKEVGDSLKSNLDLQQFIGNISNTISAVGQLATSINTLKNLGSIWSDEDISQGEKILQTVMNLSFALPALMSSISKLTSLMGTSATITEVLNNRQKVNNVLQGSGITLRELNTKVLKSNNKQEALTELLIQKECKSRLVNNGAINAETDAEIREAAAQKAENILTEEAIGLNTALNTTLLANPLTWIIAALGAAVVAYQVYNAHIEKTIQLEEERAEKAKEESDALQQEAEAHKQLYDSFINLKKQYEEGTATKQDMRDVTNELIEAYGLEAYTLDALAGNYQAVADAAKEAQKAEEAELKQAQERTIKQQSKAIFAEAKHPLDHITENNGVMNIDSSSIYGSSGDAYAPESVDEKQHIDKYNKLYKEFFGEDAQVNKNEIHNTKELIEYYNQLIQFKEKLASTPGMEGEVENIQKILDTLNADEKIDQLLEEQKNHLDSVLSGSLDADTQAEFNQKIEELRKTLQEELEQGLIPPDTDIDAAILDFASKVNNSFAKHFTLVESIKQKFGEDVRYGVITAFENLDEDLQNHLITIGFDFNADNAEQLLADYQDYYNNSAERTVAIPVSFQSQLNEDILKGKDINKGDWESILSYAPDAEDILGDRDSFNNKSIGERIELMDQLNAKFFEENKLALENAEIQTEAGKKIIKNIEQQIELKKKQLEQQLQIYENALKSDYGMYSDEEIDDFKNKIEEIRTEIESLEDEKIEINLEITNNSEQLVHNALQSMIGDVVTDTDQLITAAESVGEAWKVAAGDVAQFAAAFPDLMDEAELLADGSVQLDKEITNSALQSAKDRIEANSKVAISAIDDKLDQLAAEKEFQQSKIKILEELLNGETTEQEAVQKLNKATQDYKTELEKAGLINNAAAAEEMINHGVQCANGIIDAFQGINNALIVMHENYANLFTDGAMQTFDGGVVASTHVTSSGLLPQEQIDTPTLGDEARAAAERELEAAKARETEIDKEIASYWAAKSQIQSRSDQAGNAVDRVAQGLAGKEDKSKSKSKSDKEKKITPKDEEVFKPDLYYEIEKAIKSVDRAIQQLEDDEKNLYGKAKIKALKEENKLLDQQLNNLKEKQKIQQQEANDLRGKLSAGGVSFSAKGEVQNYNQSLESATEKYNSVIRQYNAGLVDDEQVKAAKKVLDDFKSDLDRYSKLFYDEMPELIKEMRAKIKEQLSNNLEGFELKFELKLEKKQAAREWRNFIYEMKKDFKKVYEDLDKDMSRLIKNSKTYTQKNKGTIAVDLKEIKEVQKEINKLNKGKPSDKFENISQAQEKLKELNERLQEHGEELHQIYEDAWNNYLAQIDQAKSKFEDINGVLDRTEDKMNTLIQIQEKLYGGTKTYQMRISTAQTEYDFAKDRVEVARTEFELNEKLWKESGATMENMDSWNEDQKKYYENMVSAQETLLDNLLKGAEAAEKKMTASIEKLHDDLEKTFTNGFGFDELNEQWEWIDREASEYYDIIEQGYEVQKLNNQITQDTVGMSIKGQEKLKKFQNEEIKKLREKDKLSKYELKRAQAMYDITLKEIALEEARNNKSAMKLTRNSEGNWSYQYVADEGDVNKKQQDLLDAQMNFRQLAKEEEKRLLQDYNKLSQEWESKSAALGSEFREKYGEDQSEWSKEQLAEYATAQERIQERYSHALEDIKINLSQVSRDLMAGDYTVQQTLWSQLGNDYKALTDEEIENFERFSSTTLTNFTTLYNAIVGGEEGEGGLKGIGKTAETISKKADADFHTMIENQCVDTQTLATEVQNTWKAEEEATHDYIKEIQELGEVAGIVLDKDGLEGYLNKVKIATNAAKQAATDLANEYSNTLPAAAEQVKTLEEAWKKVVSQIQKAHKKLKKYLKLKNKSNTKLEDANVDNVSASGTGAEGVDTDDFDSYSGSDTSSGGSVNNSAKEEGVAAAIWLQGASTSGWGNNPERAQKFAEKGVSGAQAIINAQGPSGQLYAKWKDRRAELSSYYYGAFDTGGYTGNWTGEGKFAMLHQKELVLNAEDTKNFLAATDSLRDLVSLDSSIEQTIANAISKMLVSMSTNNLNNLNSLRNGENNTNNIFNINAEFPNANDVTEIREAILSLPNLANQYISKQRI